MKNYHHITPWSGRAHVKPFDNLPSQWERFVFRIGLEERQVMGELRQGGERAGVIAMWVRSHVNQVYVPSKVLRELGFESRWEWQ